MEDDNEKFEASRSILLQAGGAARLKLYQTYLMKMKNGETLSRSELKAFQELEREIEGPKESGTLGDHIQAAEYLGISTRMLKWHRSNGNVRQNADGSFDRDELDRFIARHGKRKQDKDLAQRRLMADLRYRLARAEREETLVKQLKGELFTGGEIAQGWGFRVSEVTAALQSLVDRLPPLLVDKERTEIRQIIEDEVYEIRMRFSRDGRFTPAATV